MFTSVCEIELKDSNENHEEDFDFSVIIMKKLKCIIELSDTLHEKINNKTLVSN